MASHSSTPALNSNPKKHAHPGKVPASNNDSNANLSNGGAVMTGGGSNFSNGINMNGEKRLAIESQPVHAPSQGFKDGGTNGITKIDEADEPA